MSRWMMWMSRFGLALALMAGSYGCAEDDDDGGGEAQTEAGLTEEGGAEEGTDEGGAVDGEGEACGDLACPDDLSIECDADEECIGGVCVPSDTDGEPGYCSLDCEILSDCPPLWSCEALQEGEQSVCLDE